MITHNASKIACKNGSMAKILKVEIENDASIFVTKEFARDAGCVITVIVDSVVSLVMYNIYNGRPTNVLELAVKTIAIFFTICVPLFIVLLSPLQSFPCNLSEHFEEVPNPYDIYQRSLKLFHRCQ